MWWRHRHSFSLFHILGCPSRGSNSRIKVTTNCITRNSAFTTTFQVHNKNFKRNSGIFTFLAHLESRRSLKCAIYITNELWKWFHTFQVPIICMCPEGFFGLIYRVPLWKKLIYPGATSLKGLNHEIFDLCLLSEIDGPRLTPRNVIEFSHDFAKIYLPISIHFPGFETRNGRIWFVLYKKNS